MAPAWQIRHHMPSFTVDHAAMEQTRANAGLGVASGAALYVGAVLGPGVLLLPALAAQAAGPTSVLA
jgi:amino acid efflux transporter